MVTIAPPTLDQPTQAPAQSSTDIKGGGFTPSPHYQQEKVLEKSERDEDLAIEIMKLAVEHHRSATDKNDTSLVHTCEKLWRWATGETYKLPED